MTTHPATAPTDNLGSDWWHDNAWNQDTFDLVTSLTESDDQDRLRLSYIRALATEDERTAPPTDFVLRATWKLLTGEDASPEQLVDDQFWRTLFRNAEGTYGRDGWGKLRNNSLRRILRTTTFDVPDSCLDEPLLHEYLANPTLTAERLDYFWRHSWSSFGDRFDRATKIITHPNISPETLSDIFSVVMEALTSEAGKNERPFSGVHMRHLLAAPLANRSFPRGTYESYSDFFDFPQRVDGNWVKGGSEEAQAQEWVVLPWYATKEQVQAKWDKRMGEQYNLTLDRDTARYELNGFETQSLAGVESVADIFGAYSTNAHWIDHTLKNVRTQDEVEEIISNLKQSGPWNYFNIEGGEYDEATWVDLFNAMSKGYSDPAVKFTQTGLIGAAMKSETTPDWFRFLIGIDTPHLRRLPHTWLYFHGGAIQWKDSFNFDNVPDEWVLEMLTPAGVDKPGDDNWK